jgi:hypothetical protein
MHRETIKSYTFLFDLLREYRSRAGGDARTPEFDRAFDEAINNWEEEQHSAMETRSIPHMGFLRARNVGFLGDDGELAWFLHYLCFQCMRTEKMRSKCVEASPSWPGFDAARSWGLMSRIFATNMSWSFFMTRRGMHATLLVTDSQSEFITSDQPVINLDGLGSGPERPPTQATLYYPVSPTAALLLEFDRADRKTSTRQGAGRRIVSSIRSSRTFWQDLSGAVRARGRERARGSRRGF